MGRKPLNRVKCPRCKKLGTLRRKGNYSVVVSHYDKEKARRGRGKGMRTHYIGSLLFDIDKILRPYEGQLSEMYFSYFKSVLRRLKNNFAIAKDKQVPLMHDSDASVFLILLNELRKIKEDHKLHEKTVDRRVTWYHRCSSCKNIEHMHATFKGASSNSGIHLHYGKEPENPNLVFDRPKPYKRRYYGRYRRRRYT